MPPLESDADVPGVPLDAQVGPPHRLFGSAFATAGNPAMSRRAEKPDATGDWRDLGFQAERGQEHRDDRITPLSQRAVELLETGASRTSSISPSASLPPPKPPKPIMTIGQFGGTSNSKRRG